MTVRRRQLRSHGSERIREFLLQAQRFEMLDGQIARLGEERLRDYWTAHRDELMAEFVPDRDSPEISRPFGWHIFEGPASEWILNRSRGLALTGDGSWRRP